MVSIWILHSRRKLIDPSAKELPYFPRRYHVKKNKSGYLYPSRHTFPLPSLVNAIIRAALEVPRGWIATSKTGGSVWRPPDSTRSRRVLNNRMRLPEALSATLTTADSVAKSIGLNGTRILQRVAEAKINEVLASNRPLGTNNTRYEQPGCARFPAFARAIFFPNDRRSRNLTAGYQ
jgi:hypothetical protein